MPSKRKRYINKGTRLVFLTPAERREMDECPLPPELEETCFYFFGTAEPNAV